MPKHTTAAIVRTHNALRMSVILTKTKLLVKGLDEALRELVACPTYRERGLDADTSFTPEIGSS